MAGKVSGKTRLEKITDWALRPLPWGSSSDMRAIIHGRDVFSEFARSFGFPWGSFSSHQPISFSKRELTGLTKAKHYAIEVTFRGGKKPT